MRLTDPNLKIAGAICFHFRKTLLQYVTKGALHGGIAMHEAHMANVFSGWR
jgi:hypothetical protein